MSKPEFFVVENVRPRKVVRIGQRVLGVKGKGRSSAALTADEFYSSAVQNQLRQGRLVCVSHPAGAVPDVDTSVVVEEVDTPETPEPVAVVVETSAPVQGTEGEDSDSLGTVVAHDDDTDDTPAETPWTEELLADLSYSDLRSTARDLGLSSGGKAGDLIARILEHQLSAGDAPDSETSEEE